MNECKTESFFRSYDLTKEQKQPKDPAAHQHDALNKLQRWYQTKHSTHHGGILVLPTGGGKTFTAMRFLCTHPLPEGYKVLWLAHTHHLLEQSLYSLESEVKLIRNKQKLNVRVVSGTTGHFRPSQIQTSDDVLICTLQTITRAYSDNNKDNKLKEFLKAAGNKLFVVFDEAHHSPAPSYCRFIRALREDKPNMYLLGLTATPTHSNEKKVGWLNTLFLQGILYQISPRDLMATGVLAKPIFETSCTTVKPEFDENQYKQWVKDFRELPEEIITKLAENQERNAFIAKTYAENRKRYGKTIIFTDRWFQCEQLSDFIKQQDREIKVGTVYTHIDADPGSADARNKRSKNENAEVLEKFRNNKLDVLINVRMLTEGTDVPNVQSVFLTRQTTSQILMTQMVGRALRGVKFGGTKEAYIVSFIDDWQQTIN
ncbi:DEAD/DEAH box helicase [Chroococcidiopsis sp. FACHB-1243]|uniref:DEAD/DEAH box helicase n=1 Tax=Chroococcidiopsis sp. [FACHB-1243] TaxID=2692781 RepID=UPI0017835882|nr:DEAD/DEAH box helicase [Chroococcidiopsis sp. [FACHB-1243]]MBD2304091.1 DEAD/DEAH box helicase [Chroococcidiopsis sp. [FACHB-1243]]